MPRAGFPPATLRDRDAVTPSHIGKYEVQNRLGVGGMGALYLARDPGLDRLVAIKILKEEYQEDAELRERFAREARSVARLRHPNIIIVFEIGEHEGLPFMAMEYIAGETLTSVLRRKPSAPLVKRIDFIEHLCAGLAHAHAAGIIHRDIKPANIMLDGEGVLKILDFGIARLGDSGMTQDGMMMGTVNYMSPEQVVGRGVDHRSDIFAAGAVLYEAIALEQAFPGRIDTGVLHRILTEGPVPLEQRVPGIDAELAGVVRHALERDPKQRYQNADVLRRDLSRIRRRLADQGSAPETGVPGDATVLDHSRQLTSGAGRKPASDRPRRLNPERFAELQRQQVEEYLRSSEEALARGDYDAALQHAERAATVDPDSRDAFDLIDKARLALEAKAVRQLLAEAQRLLSEEHLEDAAALADEALVTLPEQSASDLRDEVRQIVEKIAAARERERRISAALERARTSIEQRGYEGALRAIYEVLAIEPERPEARELEHLAKSRLQAHREHEQARRSAYDRLTSARALAGAGKYDEAADAINAVTPPSDTVRVAAADALEEVRKSQRRAAHSAILLQARSSFEQGQFEQALAAIDSIPTEDSTSEARSLRASVAEALRKHQELEAKRRTLDSVISAIRALIDVGDLAKAHERFEDAARIGLEDERLPVLRQRIADLGVAAQEKRRQEARDRLARKRIEAAHQLMASGNGHAAIELLERDGSGHELVEGALREIRAVIAEQEERVRQEAERKRQEQEARRRAEVEAAKRLEEQRKAEEKQRQDEERRLREAEQERRRQEVATLLTAAEEALGADRPDEAVTLLKRADDVGIAAADNALARRLAATRAEAERLERKQLELQKQLAVAREQLNEGRLDAAREAARTALALDARNADAFKVLAEADREMGRREEEARRREEAKRQEEEARQREAEARRLERVVAEKLAAASQVEAHEVALTLLNEVLTLVPGDPRVQTQIAQRTVAIERQQAEDRRRRAEEERRQADEARRRAEEARQQEDARRLEEEARTRRRDEEAQRLEAEARQKAAAEEALLREQARVAREERTRLEHEETTRREREAREQRERLAREKKEEQARQKREKQQAREAEQAKRRDEKEAAAALLAERAAEKTVVRPPQPARRTVGIKYLTAAAIVVAAITAGGLLFRNLTDDDAGPQPTPTSPAPAQGLPPGGPTPAPPTTTPGQNPTIPQPTESSTAKPAQDLNAPVPAQRPSTTTARPTQGSTIPGPTRGPTAPTPGTDTRRPAERVTTVGPTQTPPVTGPVQVPTTPAPAQTQAAAGPAPSQTNEGPTQGPTVPGPTQGPTPPAPARGSPPVAQVPVAAAERAAIEQLLGQYVAAYNRMDEQRLRQIDPAFRGIPSRPLLKSVDLKLSQVSIDVTPDGQSAVMRATQNFSYVANRAQFPPTSTGQLTWNLRKIGTTWVVVP